MSRVSIGATKIRTTAGVYRFAKGSTYDRNQTAKMIGITDEL